MLGEAYAFGVMWSFAMKALSVLVLRYKMPGKREWKVPLNFRLNGVEIPVGLGMITLTLIAFATINVLTKKTATISGVIFTAAFFTAFQLSERYNRKRHAVHSEDMEKFNLSMSEQLSTESVHVRPGNVIVAVRNPDRLDHLRQVLQKTNTHKQDVVAMCILGVTGSEESELREEQMFTNQERELFTHVVTIAEKEGKTVELLVVPGIDPFFTMVQTAANIKAARLVTGVSAKMASEELARRIGKAWEDLPEPRHPLSLEIISPGRPSSFVNLGPHPPRLWPEDIDVVHNLWLDLNDDLGSKFHHRDVVGIALRRMAHDLARDREKVVSEVVGELRSRPLQLEQVPSEEPTLTD
jgi:nucleotide-binding universal stress UspA family protein